MHQCTLDALPGDLPQPQPLGTELRLHPEVKTDDPILSVRRSRDIIVPELRGTGYNVVYEEFNGGHELPPVISESSLDWFLT